MNYYMQMNRPVRQLIPRPRLSHRVKKVGSLGPVVVVRRPQPKL